MRRTIRAPMDLLTEIHPSEGTAGIILTVIAAAWSLCQFWYRNVRRTASDREVIARFLNSLSNKAVLCNPCECEHLPATYASLVEIRKELENTLSRVSVNTRARSALATMLEICSHTLQDPVVFPGRPNTLPNRVGGPTLAALIELRAAFDWAINDLERDSKLSGRFRKMPNIDDSQFD
jgi:hypothetical protein